MATNRTPNVNALPNYENAVIPREKLERYCLDPEHVSSTRGKSSGRDKARVFQRVLGFGKGDWELLKKRILEELPYYEAALFRDEDEHGKRYTVQLAIAGPNGNTGIVVTGWIVKVGDDFPSLTMARCISGA